MENLQINSVALETQHHPYPSERTKEDIVSVPSDESCDLRLLTSNQILKGWKKSFQLGCHADWRFAGWETVVTDRKKEAKPSLPTLSADALDLVLVLTSGDTFMATPLCVRDVVMRLPLSVSTMQGSPLYLHLSKALNELRNFSRLVSISVGREGCGFGIDKLPPGAVFVCGDFKSRSCCLLVYVDDLLLVTLTT